MMQKKIIVEIEKKLVKNPEKGIALKGKFKGLFRYRAGSYRIIYTNTIEGILILRIAHRKNAYK